MATKAPTTNAPAKTASDPLWILIRDSDGDVHDVKNWAWLLYEALGGGNGPLDAPHREALCLVAAELQSASYRLETLHEKLFEAAKPAVGVDTPIPRGPEPGKELEVKEKKPEPGQFEGLSVEELHHEWEVTEAGMNLALAELNRDRPGDMDSSRSDAIVDQFDARWYAIEEKLAEAEPENAEDMASMMKIALHNLGDFNVGDRDMDILGAVRRGLHAPSGKKRRASEAGTAV